MRKNTIFLFMLLVPAHQTLGEDDSPLVPAVSMKTITYSIETGEDQVLIGAQVYGGKYEDHNFLDLYENMNKQWEDRFFQSPELVLLWENAYTVTGQIEQRATMYQPGPYVDRIVANVPDPSKVKDLETELSNRSFAAKFLLGDLVFIFVRYDHGFPNPALDSPMYLPYALRKTNGKWKVSSEAHTNCIPYYLFRLSPILDPRGKTEFADPSRLESLTRFDITRAPPAIYGQFRLFVASWRPMASPNDDENALKKASLYCKVIADASMGYGQSLKQLASAESNALPPDVSVLAKLIEASGDVKTIDEQKRIWHSKCGPVIDHLAPRNAKGRTPEQLARCVAPVRISSPNHLAAAVECGLRKMFFWVSPRESKENPFFIRTVGLMDENGGPVLLRSYGTMRRYEGLICQMFELPTFKHGLIEYLRVQHPAIMAKIEPNRPPTSQ